MKKIISLILLSSILFMNTGYYLYFNYLKISIHSHIENRINNGIESKDLTIITSDNQDDIIWISKGKEFEYNGLMYDVVKIKTKNGKKYYYCISDNQETQLIKNFTQTNKNINKIFTNLKKILNNKYLPKSYVIKIFLLHSLKYFKVDVVVKNSLFLDVITPPPQI